MTGVPHTYVRSPDAVTREIAGETLIVPIRGHLADLRRIYSLNPTGAVVWDLLDGEHDVRGLCEAVAERFDVTTGEAEATVLEFLGQLRAAGLAGETP